MHQLNADASPGFPYVACLLPAGGKVAKNSDIMSNLALRAKVVDAVIERVELLSNRQVYGKTAVELVEGGYVDPVRIFVKQEPHNIEKIKAGRFRLISSVSIVDQLVERLLFSLQNKTEIEVWEDIPSKPGIGLTDESLHSVQAQARKMLERGGEIAEADISGWDWSVQSWELLGEAYMRVKLAGLSSNLPHNGEPPITYGEPFSEIVFARYHCLGLSVFGLSDGELYAQKLPGIQLSGSYTTSSSNSRMRVLAARLIGARWAMAMGDDCLEQMVPGAAGRYAALGHVVKDYQKASLNSFTFCSHHFTMTDAGSRFEPLNWGKTFYRLLSQKANSEMDACMLLAQFRQEMRHSPFLNDMMAVLERVGWGARKIGQDAGGFSQEEGWIGRRYGTGDALGKSDV